MLDRNCHGRVRSGWLITIVVLAAVATLASIWLETALSVGTANKAKLLCSALFVSQRDQQEVMGAELGSALLAPFNTSVDRQEKSVTASLLWKKNSAQFRPGLGCTRLVNIDRSELLAQLDTGVIATPADTAQQAWPHGDLVTPTAGLPVDSRQLTAAIDAAFAEVDAEREPAARINTRAVAVVWRGQLIAEKYAPGISPQTPLLGWSMNKSVTNALIGMRIKDGKLKLHSPIVEQVDFPLWAADDPRAAITLDQLLRMSSGLDFGEVYDDLESDAVTMLFGAGGFAMGNYAALRELAWPPDAQWSYSSGTTNLLQLILRSSFASLHDYWAYAHTRLFQRIGMHTMVLEPDASGTFVGSSFGYASARDWARFGLLFLNGGEWQGEQLLPDGWVQYSTTPTATDPSGGYGAQWWLNVGTATTRPFPMLPTDAYTASGFEGQNVMVVPSQQLVVVRLGYTPDRNAWSIGDFTASIIAALGAESINSPDLSP